MSVPSQTQNPNGLHQRYTVAKADGSPVDPDAIYFVLRLDGAGSDYLHIAACRSAARRYVEMAPAHLRQMADELESLLDRLDGIVCRRKS